MFQGRRGSDKYIWRVTICIVLTTKMYCALYGGLTNTMYYFAKTSRRKTDLGRWHFATGLVVIFPLPEQRVSASRNSVFKTRILVLAKYINTVAQKLKNTVFAKKSNVYKKFERYRKIKRQTFKNILISTQPTIGTRFSQWQCAWCDLWVCVFCDLAIMIYIYIGPQTMPLPLNQFWWSGQVWTGSRIRTPGQTGSGYCPDPVQNRLRIHLMKCIRQLIPFT